MNLSSPRASRPRVVAAVVLAGTAFSLSACGDSGDGASGGSVEQFCTDYAQFSQAEFLDGVDTTDVASVLTALDTMVQDAKQIRPPDEITAAWTTVFQASEDQVQVMRGVDWSSEAAQQEYFASVQDFRSDELDAATAEVETFVADRCPS